MILMSRALRILVAVVLVSLLPLRAVAGVTIGICPAGHEDMSTAAHATGHAHDGYAHEHEADSESRAPAGHTCNICAEHCSSGAFAPIAFGAPDLQPAGQDRPRFVDLAAPAFVPDQLDRPPLA